MNYTEWIKFLETVPMFGKKSGLDNIKNLMDILGNPQDELKIIHVAGTNGKGSVCAMISSILKEEGYKVGTFTSPHLIKYNERIRVNGNCINDNEFAQIGEKILNAVNILIERGYNHPTFFEIMTACCFLYFYEVGVDFAVIEVGLGGRLDATNIIKNPLVSVITPISLDHTSILGDTIEKIAEEKCGIIKKNCPVVLYSVNKTVYNKISEFIHKCNTVLFSIDKSMNVSIKSRSLEGQTFSINTQYYNYEDLEINLLGDYQIINSAIVLLIVHVLRKNNINISQLSVYKGLKNTKWPGRMELIDDNGHYFILDGAHNYEGMKNFLQSISQLVKTPLNFIIGFSKDKDYSRMIDLVLNYNNTNKIYFTSINSNRSLKSEDIIFRSNKIIYTDSIEEAYDMIKTTICKGNVTCCVGSLYLVGQMKKLLNCKKGVVEND